jgi:hemerythrin
VKVYLVYWFNQKLVELGCDTLELKCVFYDLAEARIYVNRILQKENSPKNKEKAHDEKADSLIYRIVEKDAKHFNAEETRLYEYEYSAEIWN